MTLNSNITTTAPPRPRTAATQDGWATLSPPTGTGLIPPPDFMADPIFDPAEFTALSSGIGLGLPGTHADLQYQPPVPAAAAAPPRPKVEKMQESSPQHSPPPPHQPRSTSSPSLFAHHMSPQVARPSRLNWRLLRSWPAPTNVMKHTDSIAAAMRTLTAWIERQVQQLPLPAPSHQRQQQAPELVAPNPRPGSIRAAAQTARWHRNIPTWLGGHILDFGLAILVFNGALYGILLQQTGSTWTGSLTAMLAIGWLPTLLFAYGFLLMLYGIGWIFHLRSPGQLLWCKLYKILTKN